MKATNFSFASRLAAVVLATVLTLALAACGDGEDKNPMKNNGPSATVDEQSIDELLSTETTPIMFELTKTGTHFLFDYAGSHYVGSDTLDASHTGQVSVDLRQGNHQLIWIRGINGDEWGSAVIFNPSTKTLEGSNGKGVSSRHIFYAQHDIKVAEFLMPTRKIDYTAVTACLVVEITDVAPMEGTNKNYAIGNTGSYTSLIGYMNGFPNVTSLSLVTSQYTEGEPYQEVIYNRFWPSGFGSSLTKYTDIGFTAGYFLCPKDGIDNIQLTADVKYDDGTPCPTVTLPKCSIRRGQKTTLRGPLFSGTTSDWSVTMEPYRE